ncbi:amidohydrolase [Actinokineospora sp. UTMC 2448]|uniref:amidohydrolase n=1 Tax=Actinokineospora sp. UTMC 2448 TaxID=2268449 RepID=UPI0021642ADD|nr:amidohydrolase [Actinokineospora sp. UTMC 2448]UVS79342.1 N-substituted formamide deformylase precursor [Actinokineospora sp. UTMC 2448]
MTTTSATDTHATGAPARTTLLTGGRIHSPADPHATAMAVQDGVVVWLGQDSVGATLYANAEETVDLDGAFVAPAFVDAHVHATSAGLLRTGVDLTSAPTMAAALDALAAHVRRHGRAPVWGHGWDETRWPEGRPPTRAQLDAAADGAPVYLSRVDVHSALVSTALLDRAPDAARADGWHPEGPLTRDAHHHARRAARDALTPGQRDDAQRAFLRHAAAMGVASVHECAGPDISGAADLAALLAQPGDLPEVVAYWGQPVTADAGAVAATHRVRGLAGDLFVDGALGSRTAALHAPYTDSPDTSGALYLDPAAIGEHLRACTEAGIQAGFHVIGDAAVTAVIEGFARAEQHLGRVAIAAAGHRLEHLEMVTPGQAQQLAHWGVIASVQPLFDAHWGGPHGMYAQRLGVERGTALNPFAQLAAAGVVLALGSDAPVTAVDPWAAVRAAVHHRTDGHGLSPRAAFTAHTRGGWRAAGVDDGLTGTLVPGAPATYAVWDVEDLVVAAPDARVQRWSTDPRSRVPALPRLDPGAAPPVCARTVLRGRTLFDRQENHAPA